MSIVKTVALSGHRILPEDFDRYRLQGALEDLLEEGYTSFCCGMAQGFDLLALECLIDLKYRYHVRVEACIPYSGHSASLPYSDRVRYGELLAKCDEKTVLAEEYRAGCMQARNRYMVDKSDLLFVYCTQKKGGTVYTVKYALSRGVEVRYFTP